MGDYVVQTDRTHGTLDITEKEQLNIKVQKENSPSEKSQSPTDQPGEHNYLVFTDPYPKKKTADKTPLSQDKVEQKSSQGNDLAKKTEWTVAVNLDSSGGSKTDEQGQFGGSIQSEHLAKLKEESIGKNVAIVAQLTVPNDPADPAKGSKLERYKIKDGQITQLPSQPSEGYAQDLQSLVSLAGKEEPCDKLGLIDQSHGHGTAGMHGDNGNATLPEVVDALKNGLKDTGHDKLDLLDFDACLMGEKGVLDKVKDVAKNVVASSEVETSVPHKFDAQNLEAPLRDLLQNPKMNGDDFGEKFIQEANKGANGKEVRPDGTESSGTSTLSHYNLDSYDKFNNAYNEFGKQLALAAKDSTNRSALEDLIKQTPRYAAWVDPAEVGGEERRDLKTFAQEVQDAVSKGIIKDPTGELSKSSSQLLEQQAKLVESYHGDTFHGYDKMGGLSAFLPSQSYLDTSGAAKRSTDLKILSSISDTKQFEHVMDQRSMDYIKKEFTGVEQSVEKRLPVDKQNQLTDLRNAITELNGSSDYQSFKLAVARIHDISKRLVGSELNDELAAKNLPELESKKQTTFKLEINPGDNGWNQFLTAMGANVA